MLILKIYLFFQSIFISLFTLLIFYSFQFRVEIGLNRNELGIWEKRFSKTTLKKFGSLYFARWILSLESDFHFKKSTIRASIGYFCHFFSGASDMYVDILGKPKRRIRNETGPDLAFRFHHFPNPVTCFPVHFLEMFRVLMNFHFR